MKKNNGFTLVELLAVILVLGIIMAIAGSNIIKTKKEANILEAKKMEDEIEKLGPDVYVGEKDMYGYAPNSDNIFEISDLEKYGLETPIKNPSGGEDCQAYLKIDHSTGDVIFEGHICCLGLYDTGGGDGSDCSNYNKY